MDFGTRLRHSSNGSRDLSDKSLPTLEMLLCERQQDGGIIHTDRDLYFIIVTFEYEEASFSHLPQPLNPPQLHVVCIERVVIADCPLGREDFYLIETNYQPRQTRPLQP